MNILILITGLYPDSIGGVEKIGAELSRRLAERHEVTVFLPRRGPKESEGTVRDGVRIHRIRSSSQSGFPVPGLRTLHALATILKDKQRPDVLLSMSLAFGHIGNLSRILFGIPYASYILGSDWSVAGEKSPKGGLFRWGLKHCPSLITQTGIIRKEVLDRYPGASVSVIPNGIDLPSQRARGDRLLYVGRLHPVKGLDTLFEALRPLDNPPELILVGDGPDRERLQELGEGLNVRFMGRMADPEDCFLKGRIFILPSRSEGLPQSILEAMSYGIPVVATDVGGIPEVVRSGETGLLVPPDDPGALRTAITALLEDGDLHRDMSRRCLEESRRFGWDSVLPRMEAVLEETARKSGRS